MVDFSSGFKDDCDIFLASVKKLYANVQADQPHDEFNIFCEVWRNMNFHYIFYGRSDYELIAFTEDCLNTVKHLFLNSTLELDKISAFYMLYAIYFKQPTEKFVKIRVTFEQWVRVREFVKQQERNYQIQLVFWKLFREDAFRFVFQELEMGLESMYNSGRIRSGAGKVAGDGTSQKSSIFQLMSDIESLQNQKTGMLTALDIIEIGYNDMKEKLESATNPLVNKDTKLALLPQSNFIVDIHKSLASIVESLEQRSETVELGTTLPTLAPKSSVASIEPLSSEDLTSTEDEAQPAVGNKRQQLKRKAFQGKAKELRKVKRKARAAEVVAKADVKSGETSETRRIRDPYTVRTHRRTYKSAVALQMASSKEIYKTNKSGDSVE